MLLRYLIIISLTFLLSVSCTPDVAGGASDHGNEKVAGIVTYPDGAPAAGAEICLLPGDYNHIVDSARIRCRMVVADNSGRYLFDSLPEGEYALEAILPVTQKSASIKGVMAEAGETEVPPLVVNEKGTVYLTIDTPVLGRGIMLFMPGLRYYQTIHSTERVVLSDISPGLISLRAYDPEQKREIDLGEDYYAIEIEPGLTGILRKQSPKPFCIIADTVCTGEVISGTVGEEIVFAPIDPSVTVSGSIAYRFSWGDGTISDWSSDTRWRKKYDEPGTYFVQSQLMHTLKYLAWSELVTVEIVE